MHSIDVNVCYRFYDSNLKLGGIVYKQYDVLSYFCNGLVHVAWDYIKVLEEA